MTQYINFGNSVIAANTALISALEVCRELAARVAAEATPGEDIFATGIRTDLLTIDWYNVMGTTGAWAELLATYDSGTPTVKSKMYKAL